MSALELAIVRKRHRRPGGRFLSVFEDFALSVPAGQFLAVTGPSGCGKTTLLNIAAGLDTAFEGRREVAGRDGGAPVIGYMFQEPRLLPWRSVAENLALVLPQGSQRDGVVAAWLARVGLADAGPLYPRQLSTGMARRVALARAFAVEPDLLLMDEPFASLDEPTADELRRLLLRIAGCTGATILFVTHDLDEAIALAQRILVLSPPPARIRHDLPVELSPAERRDPRALARVRAVLQRPVSLRQVSQA